MKHCLATLAAAGGLAASTVCWAKGDITKITIERVDTGAIVEITQPEVLDRFAIWSGPGVAGWDMDKTVPQRDEPAFIIDWTQGALTEAPESTTYKVTFYVDHYECNKYGVLYRVNDAGSGHVYLPRWNEEIGRCNMSLIARGVEGNWFRSSHAWDALAERLIPAHGI